MPGGMLVRTTTRPISTPIGLHLSRTARLTSRAFDEALAAAGGTLPVWLVLLNIKFRQPENQRELAEAVGIREATLTHHLSAMEANGLISRRRDPGNQRVQRIAVTEMGEVLFGRLFEAATSFDRKLRGDLTDAELDDLRTLLDRLVANLGGDEDGRPAWTGLAEERAGIPPPRRTPHQVGPAPAPGRR